MPPASQNYNLFVLKPNLLKEWHPTKNAGIKPAELTPGSGKKIWWICPEGHEWQAVVYSRSRGSGCPFCKNSKPGVANGITVSGSAFKKEWHPTANGDLNPANWTSADSTRVWWICDKGHEWQATFKARIRGGKCPNCYRFQNKNDHSGSITVNSEGSAANITDPLLEIEPLESIFGADYRKVKRYMTQATVTIEVPTNNHLFYAQMMNFSHEGMCLETSTSLTPGTKVIIRLDRPLFASSRESYDSIIKWCNGLTDEEGAVYNFGLGVKFI